MKQYRITSENIVASSPDDCLLSADDPVHVLIAAQIMGGLGADARLHAMRAAPAFSDDRATRMRENNIQAGTDEWFQLWFGR